VATAQALKAKINSVRDLQSVVKTMKALAAASIRQYQQAVESLADYNLTVEMGLQIALKNRYFSDRSFVPLSALATPSQPSDRVAAIVFGSDQGLCGQFNEQITSYSSDRLQEYGFASENLLIAAVGARVVPSLEAKGRELDARFSVPGSVTAIAAMVQEILLTIEEWREREKVDRILIFYNKSVSGSSYQPVAQQLLPLDADWLKRLETEPWPTSVFPTFSLEWEELFSGLIRQYLFVSLYRALAESLASENASRLSSMQAAEKNIGERLSDLNSEYRRQRQSSITGELLDIASGFEALTH